MVIYVPELRASETPLDETLEPLFANETVCFLAAVEFFQNFFPVTALLAKVAPA